MSLARAIVIKTSSWRPVEKLVRKSFVFRPLVRRFIAGDTLEDAITVAEKILASGMKVSLDYLGENTKTEAEAKSAKETYIAMLHRIAQSQPVREWDAKNNGERGLASGQGADPKPSQVHLIEPLNISIKLTQCGFDQGFNFAKNNYLEVLDVARDLNTFVRVDMEASEYTQRTLDMIDQVRGDHANTGTVLQSYLYRTDQDVETVISWGIRVRLVKGAYLEPASVAYPEKAKVDEAYIRQAKRLLEAGNYPAIATQDEKIISELNAFVAEKKIPKEGFEYQMLYGIRRDLQTSLLAQGYNVRIYVPFGDSWYPYFTRRLAERPANTLFILKSLFKG